MKKIKDLKLKDKAKILELDEKMLFEEIKTVSKMMYELKMKKHLNELKQTHLITALRKHIAMLKTVASCKGFNIG